MNDRLTLRENPRARELTRLLEWLERVPAFRRLKLAEHQKEATRFVKFALVGALGMVVDLTVLTTSRELIGLSLSVAVWLGFSVAVLSNFTLNRLWTFPESRQRGLGGQLAQFAVVNLIGLGINEVVVLGLHPVFSRALADPPAYLAAKVIAIGIVLFWNYFINRMWTYRGID